MLSSIMCLVAVFADCDCPAAAATAMEWSGISLVWMGVCEGVAICLLTGM